LNVFLMTPGLADTAQRRWPASPASNTGQYDKTTILANTTGQQYCFTDQHHWPGVLASNSCQYRWPAALAITTCQHHWPGIVCVSECLNV
jgi:hypothetical protein